MTISSGGILTLAGITLSSGVTLSAGYVTSTTLLSGAIIDTPEQSFHG